jgi:hypothetical protein
MALGSIHAGPPSSSQLAAIAAPCRAPPSPTLVSLPCHFGVAGRLSFGSQSPRGRKPGPGLRKRQLASHPATARIARPEKTQAVRCCPCGAPGLRGGEVRSGRDHRAAPNERHGRVPGSSCSTPQEHQQFTLRKRQGCALGDPGSQWPSAATGYIPGAALTRVAGAAVATGNSVGHSQEQHMGCARAIRRAG